MKHNILLIAFFLTMLTETRWTSAVYKTTQPQSLKSTSIAVSKPGNYDSPGTTYRLSQSISSATSPIFLGKDVILDLNGHTITYADAAYQHIPNYGFEEDLRGWDTSGAPKARIEETDRVQIFIGKKILRLFAGEEIVSEYIALPVADRSYFAMCGVTKREMRISLFVEDETGESVRCHSVVGDSTKLCCPILNRSPRLGGGFVIAHIYGQPAGSYRLRVRAETDCLIDQVDLRPAMDVGISIVTDTSPYAHNDYLYRGWHCAFFDYTRRGSVNESIESIPRVTGSGTVTIKNGVIKSGARGILSWGVQSTAQEVTVVLENVKITAAGINTNAVDVPHAVITGCRFDIDTPFIINRHVSEHAVVLRGPRKSEISNSEFFGGQGCLTIMGENSDVHHNLFVNRQTVTNHYCIMAMGDGSEIHHNRFEPEIGSGIEIFRHKRIRIHDNVFRIEASPPTCEYGHEEYSTTAIRIADYDAEPGSSRGCADNHIYKNEFHITGKDFPQYPDYIPMAWAFFHSASGGDTYVYDNEIFVEHRNPDSKAEAAAFYIGGSRNGGLWENNRITTNVPAAWIGTPYGRGERASFSNNTIIRSPDTPADFKPFRMGWYGRDDAVASQIQFRSNHFEGSDFDVDKTDADHTYSVFWTLVIETRDSDGRTVADTPVSVRDKNGEEVHTGQTDAAGNLQIELKEFDYMDRKKSYSSPYTIKIGPVTREVHLDRNLEITVTME